MTEIQKSQIDFLKTAKILETTKSPYLFHEISLLTTKYMEGKMDEVAISNHIHDIFAGVTEDSVLPFWFEVAGCTRVLEILDEVISGHPYKIYIAISTTLSYDNVLDPLVNLHFWKEMKQPESISELPSLQSRLQTNYCLPLQDLSLYDSISKTQKMCMSVRKWSASREYIFNNLNPIDGYSFFGGSTKYDNQSGLSFSQLINEYKKSYITVVCETEPEPDYSQKDSFITEKTFCPILAESMIVVVGGYETVKRFESLGIKTWNNDFGFDYWDSKHEPNYGGHLQRTEVEDKFIEVVNNINNLSINEIQNIYNRDKELVENNKKLLIRFI